jgi:hypothetical protein
VVDEHTAQLREAHAMPIARVNGRELVVIQAAKGIQFWDVTDPTAPTFTSELLLEGANEGDYTNAAWWTSWQGRWVFVAGVNNGTYVVDAVDPAAPVLVKRIPSTETGGFLVGPTFALGDRLVISDTNAIVEYNYALLDIVDPAAPFLITTLGGTLMQLYASTALGDRIYGLGRGNHLHIVSWENDTLEMVTDLSGMGAASYGSVQDGFLHYGGKDFYQKVDISNELDPKVVQKIKLDRPDTDHGQAWAFGNLVYIGNDHGTGSVLSPHALEPDTNPPAMIRAYPAHGTKHVPSSSRISLCFSDNLDFASVTPESVEVSKVGGGAITGIFNYWNNTVQFGPDQPWEADSEYQITIKAGGVRDVVGNPVADDTVIVFSTGEGPPGFGGSGEDAAEEESGCGCELPARTGRADLGLIGIALAFLAMARRRR